MCLPCIKTNFYSEWRARHHPLELREEISTPPERLLQVIWFHQRLLRNQLKTVDGRAVQVLHPGFWNHGAGPDFSRAVLQFDGGSPCSGDVEVDLQSSGWQSHRHHQNPNYSNVLLHVIWEDDHKTPLPTLALKPFLDAPLGELAFWLGSSDAAKTFPDGLAGHCRQPFEGLPAERVLELLHQAALVRFQGKAAQMACRARQVGWEQALWEGLFRALGYKQNVWPMQRLAELRDRIAPDNVIFPPLGLQARLLGVGGLLPWQLSSKQAGSDSYLRHLWDYWWRERESFRECMLPQTAWTFYGLRPANHPQRRLGLAAHWLAARDLIERLEKWGAESIASSDAAAASFAEQYTGLPFRLD